jgi:hypothetical protein
VNLICLGFYTLWRNRNKFQFYMKLHPNFEDFSSYHNFESMETRANILVREFCFCFWGGGFAYMCMFWVFCCLFFGIFCL